MKTIPVSILSTIRCLLAIPRVNTELPGSKWELLVHVIAPTSFFTLKKEHRRAEKLFIRCSFLWCSIYRYCGLHLGSISFNPLSLLEYFRPSINTLFTGSAIFTAAVSVQSGIIFGCFSREFFCTETQSFRRHKVDRYQWLIPYTINHKSYIIHTQFVSECEKVVKSPAVCTQKRLLHVLMITSNAIEHDPLFTG